MIHVGTSGWSYRHWEGVLYPHDLPPRQRLDHYLARYRTVELNASYYRWPADSAFVYWRRRLPADFVLAVKAPRGLTHQRRLYGPERWIERIRGGFARLVPVRSILLVQLSPRFEIDLPRLDYFLARLPTELQVAVEMRHASWHREETFRLLERHRAAYCVMSGAHLPCILRATSSLVYARLHGPDQGARMAARTPRATCAGGPTARANGRRRAEKSSSTSTTTAAAMLCATPTGCASCLASDSPYFASKSCRLTGST